MASKGFSCTFCRVLVISPFKGVLELTCRVGNNCEERWFDFWGKRSVVPGKEHISFEMTSHDAQANANHAAGAPSSRRRRRTWRLTD
jgi:hypothetical protein